MILLEFTATPHSTRDYFPMLLANGRDAVLVDYSGSMMTGSPEHAHRELNQGVLSGWYKIAHRKRQESILPVIQTGYHMISNGEHFDPNDYQQTFDPITAILTTRVTASGFVLSIESFVTKNSILIEHFKILSVPDGCNELELFIAAPSPGLYPLAFPVKPDISMRAQKKKKIIKYKYNLRGIAGNAFMWTDRMPEKMSDHSMCFTDLKGCREITKYLLVCDDTDESSHRLAGNEILRNRAFYNFKHQRAEHVREWKKYTGMSSISIPDENLQYLFNLGVYTLKAHQHPVTGAATVGMFPPLWGGGGIFGYDTYYLQQALLRTNHIDESRNLLSFWKLCSKQARALAKEFEKPGMFFPWWCFTPLGDVYDSKREQQLCDVYDSKREQRLMEKHLDTCVIALEFLRHYESTGDDSELIANWSIIIDCLEFLLSETVVEFDDEAVIKTMQGANESIAVSNDTLMALVTSKVLEMVEALAPSVGKKVPARYGLVLKKLREGLLKNYSGEVLMPFRGASQPGALPLIAAVFNLPQGVGIKSVVAALDCTKTPWGLDCGWPTEMYRDWPWFHFRAAIALAFLGNKKAASYLFSGNKYTSALGAFPEKIRIDGYVIGYWYMSVHALFVFALTSLLVNEADNSINIFHQLSSKWKDVKIRRLRIPPGFLISAILQGGIIREVIVKNDTGKLVETTVRIPSQLLVNSSREKDTVFPIRLLPGQEQKVI